MKTVAQKQREKRKSKHVTSGKPKQCFSPKEKIRKKLRATEVKISKNKLRKVTATVKAGDSDSSKVKLKTTARLPATAEDYSSNWKALLQTEKIQKKNKFEIKKVKKQKKAEKSSHTAPIQQKPEVWFDGVDESLLEVTSQTHPVADSGMNTSQNKNPLVKHKAFEGITNAVAMDCEMVGVGKDGVDSILARVSIVNVFGKCIYDKYVRPTEYVTDYRTHVSGIRRHHIQSGEDFKVVQKEVYDIIKDRILVGHALQNDLKVLYLDHSSKLTRDTSRYKPFRQVFKGKNPSLKKLTAKILGVSVQEGEHSSVQDAQAAMRLYTMHKNIWEKKISEKFKVHRRAEKSKKKKSKTIDIADLDSD